MKLPLKVGLPLLGVLLLGLAFVEGREQTVLLVIAMGVALWSAFSLPHPGPRPAPRSLVERSLPEDVRDAVGDDEDDPPPRAS